VAKAGVSLRALRREIMAGNGRSLRDLYRTFTNPGRRACAKAGRKGLSGCER
jgi:hypothetical protein